MNLDLPVMDSFISLFDPGSSDEPPMSYQNDNHHVDESSSSSSSSSSTFLTPSASQEEICMNNNNNVEKFIGRDDMTQDFPPEPELGNIEYKLKLINPNRQRFEHLVTQMNWRLREGNGKAIYEIGVEDCGRLKGLSVEEMKESLKTLNEMAKKLGATASVVRKSVVVGSAEGNNGHTRTVCEVLIRKIPDDHPIQELRIAVMGNENAGKSTMLGVLTQGELDDGRGKSRLNMFRHLHEFQSGKTSSISHEIIGLDEMGRIINYQEGSPQTICERSTKIVTLLDLAGSPKYLRTTLHGISGYSPEFVFFVLSASQGFTKMAMDHLALAAALKISLVVIITKVDLVSQDKLDATVDDVMVYLNGICHKETYRISNEEDVISFVGNQQHDIDVPILCFSSVTGHGLDLVTKLLHLMQPGLSSKDRDRLEKEQPFFQIDEMFRIPQKRIILGGLLKQGIIKERTSLLLGPFYDGTFHPVWINSIRRHKTPCSIAKAGQSVSLSLGTDIKGLRKGMVLISPQLQPKATYYFQASISVLYHSTAICKGFQTTIHIGNVRQTAIIEEILSVSRIATNERAVALFRFIKHPEYIQIGSQLLFRDGNTKGYGTVTEVFSFDITPLQ